jgi:hypothetical protein
MFRHGSAIFRESTNTKANTPLPVLIVFSSFILVYKKCKRYGIHALTQRRYHNEPLPAQAGNRLCYSLDHTYKHLPHVCDQKGSRTVKLLILMNWMYMDGYMCCNMEYTSEYIPERAFEVSRFWWFGAWRNALWRCLGLTPIISYLLICNLLCFIMRICWSIYRMYENARYE